MPGSFDGIVIYAPSYQISRYTPLNSLHNTYKSAFLPNFIISANRWKHETKIAYRGKIRAH